MNSFYKRKEHLNTTCVVYQVFKKKKIFYFTLEMSGLKQKLANDLLNQARKRYTFHR